MAEEVTAYLKGENQQTMKQNALKRARQYQAKPIMTKFLADMGLQAHPELIAVEIDAKICA
jgi:hypothetical protein